MVERLAEDNVIDNREIKLKDALNDILPQIKTVDIAVGYFYFSGLSQVIDALEKTDKSDCYFLPHLTIILLNLFMKFIRILRRLKKNFEI